MGDYILSNFDNEEIRELIIAFARLYNELGSAEFGVTAFALAEEQARIEKEEKTGEAR